MSALNLNLNSTSLEFIEQQYALYLADPGSVAADWKLYFDELRREMPRPSVERIGPTFNPRSIFHAPAADPDASPELLLEERTWQLIRNYRVRGHIVAQIDPLDQPRPDPPSLHPELYGITEKDYDRPVLITTIGGSPVKNVRELIERLQNTYCRSIGVQFMHIDSMFVRSWLQNRMEETENRLKLSREEQLRILKRLTDAVVFESFIQKKYLGAKSFSLEGGETLIPLLDLAIEKAGADGVQQVVIGMAHRGRLNVLSNIMGKPARHILREFEDIDPERYLGGGDVKYHMGYSSDWVCANGHNIHLSLCFNPSHLEFVNPVALGKIRAKQDSIDDKARTRGMAILIHGDAAFAGEGVVQETLNLSQLKGYSTGGTIHVIVNNQLGFTTQPFQGRSSIYASDIAKFIQVPIFHVNGENPEAVAQVVELAMDFRKKFQRDVVIDMYCYRLRGHNEGDEPEFTQPLMYKNIKARKPVREAYLDSLLALNEVTREEADELKEQALAKLEIELEAARAGDYSHPIRGMQGIWAAYKGGRDKDVEDVETGVKPKRLRRVMRAMSETPAEFTPHPKLVRLLEQRLKMADGELPLDWATAELAAFATLADSGIRIRLSGQDSERGTFTQRHAVLHDYETGRVRHMLRHISENQGPVEIVNSPLSEAGVLGFDYGYSLDAPGGLIAWEGQFGDFINTAQVIIDQFLCSAEDKWNRLSGIVLLLPHGFEGQGPEHSSARIERFLTMAAEDNIQVVIPTTPAQHFHCLRRQVIRPWRKPLIVMTPKSLLRHKDVVSPIEEFQKGKFERILPEVEELDPQQVSRILLCSGKIYYDLLDYRRQQGRKDVPIIRLEQLYPLAKDQLAEILAPYPDNTPIHWVQEEPENMGAWRFLYCRFQGRVLDRFPLSVVCRKSSASPATGSKRAHQMEQDALLEKAFG